ncbi:MAG: LysE family transporter [Pseudomonadota bacterium]
MENLAALLPAAFALMASPGPVTLASAGFGAAWGSSAIPLVLAMTAGTATIIVMVALGILGLITAVPGAEPVLMTLGGAYILYLAWRIWHAPVSTRALQAGQMPSVATVYSGALANPKAYAAMAALFSGFPIFPEDPVTNGIAKVVLLIAFATCVNLTWMSIGTALARLVTSPKAGRNLNRAFAVMLILSVGAMVIL